MFRPTCSSGVQLVEPVLGGVKGNESPPAPSVPVLAIPRLATLRLKDCGGLGCPAASEATATRSGVIRTGRQLKDNSLRLARPSAGRRVLLPTGKGGER